MQCCMYEESDSVSCPDCDNLPDKGAEQQTYTCPRQASRLRRSRYLEVSRAVLIRESCVRRGRCLRSGLRRLRWPCCWAA